MNQGIASPIALKPDRLALRLQVPKQMLERAEKLLDAGNHTEACMLVDTAARLL